MASPEAVYKVDIGTDESDSYDSKEFLERLLKPYYPDLSIEFFSETKEQYELEKLRRKVGSK